jgi:hypothetical protein
MSIKKSPAIAEAISKPGIKKKTVSKEITE